jgi:hypothetical protein
MNNSKKRVFKVSYLREASKDVEKMMVCDTFGFMLAIKQVCLQNNLDPYNFAHISVAIELLKHQVSWN